MRSGGRIAFTGLVNRRPLAELTHQEIRNALRVAGIREAHNGHFAKRLTERGPSFGIETLDDLARALNGAVANKTDRAIEILLQPSRARIIVNEAGHFVTLTGPGGGL